MNGLVAQLGKQRVHCRVEVRDRLVIVIPKDDSARGADRRKEILKLAREAGFTHVALELDPDGAALSRD